MFAAEHTASQPRTSAPSQRWRSDERRGVDPEGEGRAANAGSACTASKAGSTAANTISGSIQPPHRRSRVLRRQVLGEEDQGGATRPARQTRWRSREATAREDHRAVRSARCAAAPRTTPQAGRSQRAGVRSEGPRSGLPARDHAGWPAERPCIAYARYASRASPSPGSTRSKCAAGKGGARCWPSRREPCLNPG